MTRQPRPDRFRAAASFMARCHSGLMLIVIITGSAAARAEETSSSLLNAPSLIKEQHEAASLQQILDAIEARAKLLEATTFSPTTRLSVQATFVVGGNQFGGSDTSLLHESRKTFGATTSNYDNRMALDTSFTGKDLLRIRLRSGNFDVSTNSFGGAGPSTLSQLEVAFQEGDQPGRLAVNRMYYQFPIGDFMVTLGSRVEQDTTLAIWPTNYPKESVLDLLSFGGSIGAINLAVGAGAGLWWQSKGFAISASYIAVNGYEGNPSDGGIGNPQSGSTAIAQVGYSGQNWAIAATYSYLQNGNGLIPYGTNFTLRSLTNPGNTSGLGIGGYWQPTQSNWIPSINMGWGANFTSYDRSVNADGLVRVSQAWSVGLQWNDALQKGNTFGIGMGQPTFATALVGGDTPNDGNVVWEWWYKVQLSDNITLTPALFYLSRPLGGDTPEGRSFHQLGGLIKTSFRF